MWGQTRVCVSIYRIPTFPQQRRLRPGSAAGGLPQTGEVRRERDSRSLLALSQQRLFHRFHPLGDGGIPARSRRFGSL